MIVSDIKTRVKRQFGDEAQVQITDTDIVRWINDGQRYVVTNNDGVLEKTATANVIAGQQEYTLPADCLITRSIKVKYPDNVYYKLDPVSLSNFDNLINGWEGTTSHRGYPTTYHIYAGKFKVFPVPDIAITSGWEIYYSRFPVDVVNDADTIDLPLPYHNLIVNYCLQQAYELDEDWEASAKKAEQVQTEMTLNREREKFQPRETYPIITVMPDDAW
jgi:hypothetical protein